MQDVKVGDRVRANFEINYINYDEIGTILKINFKNDLYYLVEFDKEFDFMHSGNVTSPSFGIGKPKHCWWVNQVEKIENTIISNEKYILL